MHEIPYPYEAQAAATPMWLIGLCLLALLVLATVGWFPIGVRFGRRVSSHLIVLFVISIIPGFFVALHFGGEAGVVVFTLALSLLVLVVSIACIVSFDRMCRKRGFHASDLAQRLGEPGAVPAVGQASAALCPECGTVLADDAPEGLCPRCLLHSGLGSAFPSPMESDEHTGAYRGPFVAPMPADLARFFPQMEILALLGQGGMGAVYKARQVKLDRLVALKILPPEWGKDPAFAERFAREARALAKLSHPHIVAVHDFGESEGLYYFVMEYVDGANLRQVLQNGQFPPDEALRVVPQLCEALQYAHEEGIVHRDIKPENILLDRRSRVKVADFGLAKLVGPTPAHFTLTGSRQVVGTPHYMAPEQMEKPHTVDHRADIYSLGVVLYEMLTGELPLGRFAPPSQKAAVDARLDEVVLRTLAKEPAERYQRASEVKTDLESVSAGSEHQAFGKRDTVTARRPGEGEMLVVSYFHFGETLRTGVFGRLRYDGTALTMEMEIQEIERGWFRNEVTKTWKEKTIPLENIQSIQVKRGWLGPKILLRTSRLNAVLDIPGSSDGMIVLRVARRRWATAERLVAAVRRKLGLDSQWRECTPNTPPQPTGFLRRKMHSLARAARFWVVDSAASRASVADEPPSVVQAQSAVPQRATAPARVPALRGRRSLWVAGSIVVLLAGAVVLWFTTGGAQHSLRGTVVMTTNRLSPPRGEPPGSEGPYPVPVAAYQYPSMNLQPAQIESMNRILKDAHQEYLSIERKYTQWQVVEQDQRVRVTIAPFPKELEELEHRVWKQIDQILDIRQQSEARERRIIFGEWFPYGKDGWDLEIWRMGNWFHWKTARPAKGGALSGNTGKGPKLPAQFRRFWEGSPAKTENSKLNHVP